MKEYSILIIHDGGSPYYLKNYNTFESCFEALKNIISLEKERGRRYFVDNDFYKNEFQFLGYDKIKYLCIKEREISEWKTLTQENKNKNSKDKNKKVVNILNYF